jgi:hypothetical protein
MRALNGSGQATQRPDWVMCGTQWPGGQVAIFASTELNQAELEGQRDSYDIDPFALLGPVRTPPMRYTLSVEMRTFVIVVGDTYEQAFRSLFEQWSPSGQGEDRREIGSAVPAISS